MKKVGNRRNAIRHVHFFHPDYTVGTGFQPVQHSLAGLSTTSLHRRWGIAPRPEVVLIICMRGCGVKDRKYWKKRDYEVYC